MKRTKRIVGAIVLAAMTIVVVAGAVCALWLSLPLLSPAKSHVDPSDIPVLDTDAKIVRPAPPVSLRSGVVAPGPSESRAITS